MVLHQRMPNNRLRATGSGVFGINRHVKLSRQKGVRARRLRGLGLPARERAFSDQGKTAEIVPLQIPGIRLRLTLQALAGNTHRGMLQIRSTAVFAASH